MIQMKKNNLQDVLSNKFDYFTLIKVNESMEFLKSLYDIQKSTSTGDIIFIVSNTYLIDEYYKYINRIKLKKNINYNVKNIDNTVCSINPSQFISSKNKR
jgi:hypothetical protein